MDYQHRVESQHALAVYKKIEIKLYINVCISLSILVNLKSSDLYPVPDLYTLSDLCLICIHIFNVLRSVSLQKHARAIYREFLSFKN